MSFISYTILFTFLLCIVLYLRKRWSRPDETVIRLLTAFEDKEFRSQTVSELASGSLLPDHEVRRALTSNTSIFTDEITPENQNVYRVTQKGKDMRDRRKLYRGKDGEMDWDAYIRTPQMRKLVQELREEEWVKKLNKVQIWRH